MATEIALAVLKKSVEKAKQYLAQPDKKVAHLRFFMRNLEEDIETVSACEVLDPQLADESLQNRIEARELRRQIEILLLDEPEPVATINVIEQPSISKSKGTKLAPLKLPVFEGDPTKFKVFMNAFTENVISNGDVSETAKWIRLKECLKGVPLELIADLPETPDMLPVAIQTLQEVYGGDSRTVTELYHKMQSLPPAKNDAMSLRLTYSKIDGFLRALERLNHDVNGNDYIRSVFIGKFPESIVEKILTDASTPLKDLRAATSKIIIARETARQQLSASRPEQPTQRQTPYTDDGSRQRRSDDGFRGRRADGASSGPTRLGPGMPPRCLFCGIRHWPDECPTYTTAEERKKKAMNRCVKCLRYQHPGTDCIRQRRCVFCDSDQHNRAFCPTQFPTPKTAPDKILAVTEKGPQGTRTRWLRKKGKFLTLLTAAKSAHCSAPQTIRVVLDTAGSRSLITREAAQKLGLKTASDSFAFSGIDEATKLAPAVESTFSLLTQDNSEIEFGAYVVEEIATDLAVPNVKRFKFEHPELAHLYIPETGEGQPIDVLLGGDALIDVVLFDRGYIVDEETQLLATRFGYIIYTRTLAEQYYTERDKMFMILEDDHIRRMVDLEAVGLADVGYTEIETEKRAIKKFYEKLIFRDARYWISWPWREDNPQIHSNYGLALGSLRSLLRRLIKQPELLAAYHIIMQQQEKDDVIEKVDFTPSDIKLIHYIPHHPVICPEKNTKIRIVYNGSAKMRHADKSLNDHILKGSKWLTDMTKTLLRFRKYKNAIVGDVAKAFHQIGVNEEDRDVLRFLWLKDPQKPVTPENIQMYRFKRVAFGIVASPFLLDATIKHHLSQQKKTPLVLLLQQDLYADNFVASVPETVDLLQMYSEAKGIFASMSMNITKWTTNNKTLEMSIPIEDRSLERIQSILGMQWDIDRDTLGIKPSKGHDVTKKATKRNILSRTAAVFDPLGWAVPVVLSAKLLLRKLWERSAPWDEEAKAEIQKEWQCIAAQLEKTAQIHLPRMYFHTETVDEQTTFTLHAFVDASAMAYAVVVYLVKSSGAGIESSFVAAKSRLAPRKPVSIPRLELVAIRIGAKYINYIAETLQLEVAPKKIIWSDSKCALAWARAERLLPVTIQKQVDELKKNPIDQYRYVPSSMNQADVATRGATVEILEAEEWWKAPHWITKEALWPPNRSELDPVTEKEMFMFEQIKPKALNVTIAESEKQGVLAVNIKDFSSLYTLLTRTVTMMKAFGIFNRLWKDQYESEFVAARALWLRWDQEREYTSKATRIGKRRIFRDENGIIRCENRMQNADHPHHQVNQILLVKGSTLTKLIILHIHSMNYHAGTAQVLARLRKQYYLPQARREIFKIIRNECKKCTRATAVPYAPPVPAPLPEFRVQKTDRPFDSIGMDTFGPFMVRMNKTEAQIKQKRWVVIFTCTVVRAIHLEVIEDMTTEEILGAFRRFVARRGTPRRIVCDNAPQFRVLDKKFSNIWKVFANEKPVVKYFAQQEISWKFIPENAPWMGGMYERLIQSVKGAIERTYGNLVMFYRQFENSIIEIESVVNTRPLNYIDKSYDGPIITPADFLALTFPAIPINTEIEAQDDLLTKMWKSSQRRLDQFWKDWSDHYLAALRDRDDCLKGRARKSEEAPKPGDVVLMVDPSQKRSKWALALVERRIPSDDGKIRAVQIKIANGARLIRPVVKLAPIGVNTELPGVEDQQLNPKRDAIIVADAEGALEEQNDEDQQPARDDEEELDDDVVND